jgi:hypothetical protein
MRPKLIVILFSIVLSACASYPSDPTEQATFHVKKADELISKLDARNAANQINDALRLPTGDAKLKELFKRSPNGLVYYRAFLELMIESINNQWSAAGAKETLSMVKTAGIFNDEQMAALLESLRVRVIKGNMDSSIPFDLGAKLDYFPELDTPDNLKVIIDRTINGLKNENSQNRLVPQLMLYVEKVGVTSIEGARIKSLLPVMKIKGGELKTVATVFPEFAKQRQAEITEPVIFNFKNGDRLDAEDMQEVLHKKIRGVEWVKSTTANATTLQIEKIRYTEKIIPEKVETITYAQYQVDLGTALFMPNNSSYLYDIVTGGSEIEFAYVVTATHRDKQIFDEIVRGKVGGQTNRCQNLRVQNVFGGVTSIGYIANNDMKARCGGSIATPIEDLRREISTKVLDTVLKVPTIKYAHTEN